MSKELSISEKIEFVRKKGWHTYYNAEYWVHPQTVEDPMRQDYTNYGMTLNEAYQYEKNGGKPFPPQPDVIKILKSTNQ